MSSTCLRAPYAMSGTDIARQSSTYHPLQAFWRIRCPDHPPRMHSISTDIAQASCPTHSPLPSIQLPLLPWYATSYAPATLCPVLTWRMLLPACLPWLYRVATPYPIMLRAQYALSGTKAGYNATHSIPVLKQGIMLRARYVMSGTKTAYAATRRTSTLVSVRQCSYLAPPTSTASPVSPYALATRLLSSTVFLVQAVLKKHQYKFLGLRRMQCPALTRGPYC
eukprot:3935787-Rhodomonas_salina.2